MIPHGVFSNSGCKISLGAIKVVKEGMTVLTTAVGSIERIGQMTQLYSAIIR